MAFVTLQYQFTTKGGSVLFINKYKHHFSFKARWKMSPPSVLLPIKSTYNDTSNGMCEKIFIQFFFDDFFSQFVNVKFYSP